MKQTIDNILFEQSYASITSASPEAILKAAEKFRDTTWAKRELQRANTLRQRLGMAVVNVPVGHHLFA